MRLFILYLKSLSQIFAIIALKPFAFFYRVLSKKKIYLFIERGYDAQDNAFYMYKYYKNKNYNCKYIITKNSADIANICLKDIVLYGSIAHLFYISCAYRIISSHHMTFIPGIISNSIKRKLLHFKGKIIFLQHGVIKDNLVSLYKNKTNIDLFICGAKPEFDYIKEYFGYNDSQLKYTGLARFDALFNSIDNCKHKIKKIMIMPTWRNYLNESNFLDSCFYNRWVDLLNDKELLKLCLDNKVEISFVPHPEIQKLILKCKINMPGCADFTGLNIQKEIMSSDVLITDYSSVFFDFAYLKKPIVYYQFDEDTFRKKHYCEGYFDYKKMGFGPVLSEKKDVVEYIKKIIDNNAIDYSSRHSFFFTLFDNKNRERIFNEIENCK